MWCCGVHCAALLVLIGERSVVLWGEANVFAQQPTALLPQPWLKLSAPVLSAP